MAFRDRLFATIRAAGPLPEGTGVLVVGSEVPNLLEASVAATLVVSQDLDILVALGLLMMASPGDHDELDAAYQGLRPELRYAVRSNLTLLSTG